MTYTQDQRDQFQHRDREYQHSHRHPGSRACRGSQNRAERVAGRAQGRGGNEVRGVRSVRALRPPGRD